MANKDDLEATLRAHKAAVDSTKGTERYFAGDAKNFDTIENLKRDQPERFL